MARFFVILIKCVSARLFDFFEIPGHQGIELALVRILAVDGTAVDLAGFLAGVLNQEWAFEQDLVARSASRALALAFREQRLVLFLIEIRANETADLARCLLSAELDSR